jgi:FAD/FMN-containing dehydrogenase
MKIKFTKRKTGLILLVIFLLFFGRPLAFLTYHYLKDKEVKLSLDPGFVNDASRMNETKVDTVILVAAAPAEAETQLIHLIQKAGDEGKKISIAGSQHSMGGHTIYPGVIVLNMKTFNKMELDTLNNVLTVGSGATWAEVIPFLDKFHRSVAVMQSNNSFSVGGSVSVNCHGWQPNSGPIASTVESFSILTAEGIIRDCSRTNNPELFSLALGGYGLFGIILEIKLRVILNSSYRMYQYVVASENYVLEFEEWVNKRTDVGMAYGRLEIDPGNFLDEAIISICTVDSVEPIPELTPTGFRSFRRTVFRSSVNSNYGKKLRWRIEKMAGKLSKGKLFSRNQLINDPVEIFQNRQPGYTDILHEYFIPKDSVSSFIKVLKNTIPQYKVNLLNITVRNVLSDEDVFLRYASSEVFGFVMLYNQSTTPEAEKEMRRCTEKLIDVALALKGTYYLPYRLHANKEQLSKAYPMSKEFFLLKKKYDSQEIFQNEFYKKYK